MLLNRTVGRAARGDQAARNLLVVAFMGLARSIALAQAPWCAEDATQQAVADALAGFHTFRLSGRAQPRFQFAAWFATVARNATTKMARRLARGCGTEEGDALLARIPDESTPDVGAAYDELVAVATQAMPLGVRLGRTSLKQRLTARQFAAKTGLKASGANYQRNLAHRFFEAAAEVTL
ncbi:MAG: hypothetical protein U1F36_22555 [Planctomycetota bacterium]